MAEKMIRALMFTYGREVDNPAYIEGVDGSPEKVVVEGLARLGEVVDVTRPIDLERGERLDAFFTDDQRKEIEAGNYKGPDAPSIYQARLNEARAQAQAIEDESAVPGETPDISEMDAQEIGAYIHENKLNVEKTLALAGDDANADTLEKLLDAETHAGQLNEADPRKGVVDGLEAKLAAATTG